MGGGGRVCRWEATAEGCRRGSNCAFQHVNSARATAGGGRSRAQLPGSPSLFRAAGEATPAFYTHYIKTPDKPLADAVSMRRLIASAAACDDVARLVSSLANPQEGLRRVQEICAANPRYRVDAGSSANDISFQTVVVPLLRLVTSETFLYGTTLSHCVNNVLSTLHTWGGFEDAVVRCVDELAARKVWRDTAITLAPSERFSSWQPASWRQVLAPVLAYFAEVMSRFQGAAADDPTLERARRVLSAFDSWAGDDGRGGGAVASSSRSSESGDGGGSGGVGGGGEERAVVMLRRVVAQAERRHRMLEERRAVEAAASLFEVPGSGRRRRIGGDGGGGFSDDDDGPGYLSASGVPRHENDKVDYREIDLAPSKEEAFSVRSPYLPKAATWARAGGGGSGILGQQPRQAEERDEAVERMLDGLFRMFREDFMRPLRLAALEFLEAGGIGSLGAGDRFRGLGRGARGDNGQEVDVPVYRNARLTDVEASRERWGHLLFTMSFEPPQRVAAMRTEEARLRFWDRSRFLSHGSLMMLWVETDRDGRERGGVERGGGLAADVSVSFMVVSHRDVRKLAAHPPTVGLACLRDEDATALRALTRTDVRIALLEASASFFAYEPVLRALQELSVARTPFLCSVLHSAAQDFPDYIDQRTTFNLTSLLAESADVDVADIVRAVPLRNEGSVRQAFEALRRHGRLDESQLRAVFNSLVARVSLTQGPPGTGKTYIGVQLVRLLLKNTVCKPSDGQAKPVVGPILLVCYTNHALDQLLRHLLDGGVNSRDVVRVGGRSQDERIQALSLFNRRDEANTSRAVWRLKKDIQDEVRLLQERIRILAKHANFGNEARRRGNRRSRAQQQEELPWLLFWENVVLFYPDFAQAVERAAAECSMGTEQFWWASLDGSRRSLEEDLDEWALFEGQAGVGLQAGGGAAVAEAAAAAGKEMRSGDGGAGKGRQGAQRASGTSDGPADPGLFKTGTGIYDIFLAYPDEEDQLEEDDREDSHDEDDTEEEKVDDDDDGVYGDAFHIGLLGGHGAVVVQPDDDEDAGEDEAGLLDPRESAAAAVAAAMAEEEINQRRAAAAAARDRRLRQERERAAREARPLRRAEDILMDPTLDVLDLQTAEFWALDDFLRNRQAASSLDELQAELESMRREGLELTKYQDQERLDVLRNARIVGVTTTGAAKQQGLIAAMGARVLLVEEAAEVLAPHILASISQSTQQLVLIGDHLQLRPKVEVYELSVESGHGYDLDKSLFEWLVKDAGASVCTLDRQRRMRPSISRLIRAVYPALKDASEVAAYPDVRGMRQNLWWMDHREFESAGDDGKSLKSKRNGFEAEMVAGLVKYLLQQGYEKDDIAVITPYVGQLLLLRHVLSSKSAMQVVLSSRDEEEVSRFADAETCGGGLAEMGIADMEATGDGASGGAKGAGAGRWFADAREDLAVETAPMAKFVRLATIDNFQGEEAKVVILSLVRSNPVARAGFLASPNRTNVLLSRAMHGMFILGNAETVGGSGQSALWRVVLEEMRSGGQVGDFLPLRCPRHNRETDIRSPSEFETLAGDGGCAANCETQMPCGHLCPLRCHPQDAEHRTVHCTKPCLRLRDTDVCPSRHPCPKECGVECGRCEMLVPTVKLPCGHTVANVPCWESRMLDRIRCRELVEVKRECGHTVDRVRCHDADHVRKEPCNEKVSFVHERCGHENKASCCKLAETREDPVSCTQACGRPLARCGHPCVEPCGRCRQATERASGEHEGKCGQSCGRNLMCGHTCQATCHESLGPCPPCGAPCTVRCPHSGRQCQAKCAHPHPACAEKCLWRCSHRGWCQLPCGAPCDRLPCDLRCRGKLKCGHQCPSVCGHLGKCPKEFCRHCASERRAALTVDWITLATLSEHDPDQSPLIVFACGHCMTMESADSLVGLDEAYLRAPPGAGGDRADGSGDGGGAGGAGSGSGGGAGDWTAPKKLVAGVAKTRPACPECRRPLDNGAGRYGRVLSKCNADAAERNFLVGLQGRLDSALAEVAAAEDVCRSSMVPNHRARMLVGRARNNVMSLGKLCTEHPLLRVFNMTLVTLRRLAESLPAALEDPALVARLAASEMPRPQAQPIAKCFMALARLSALVMEMPKPRARTDDVRRGLEERTFNEAVTYCRIAQQELSAARMDRMRLEAVLLMVNVYGRYVVVLDRDGPRSLDRRRTLLNEAGQALAQVKRELEESELPGADQLAHGAEELTAWLRKLREMGSLSSEEAKMVFRAIGISGGGWTGQGHWYTCPNGHVYVIGDCGGAVAESRCPECGAGIGGSGHRLLATNRRADEFLRVAQG